MPRIHFKPSVEHATGEKGQVKLLLTYAEQSCFAYNQVPLPSLARDVCSDRVAAGGRHPC